jgi:hypothetical protein
MTEAQSANARLAVVAGSVYLRHHVDPATPAEIADIVRNLSDSMSDLSEKYLAGAQNDDPEVTKLRSDGSSAAAHIAELCK